MGLWKRPLLQSVHAGLMTPQYDGPEIPSYVHHASQLALASGAAAERTIRARSGTILLSLADISRSEAIGIGVSQCTYTDEQNLLSEVASSPLFVKIVANIFSVTPNKPPSLRPV